MTADDATSTVGERDAAKYIGYSCAYLRLCRRHSRGPAYLRAGRSIRYRIVDLESWLEGQRVETADSRRRTVLLKKKAHEWNVEADRYLAQRDELLVSLERIHQTLSALVAITTSTITNVKKGRP